MEVGVMGSEGRVCGNEGESREPDIGSGKREEYSSLFSHRGASTASGSPSWIKRTETDSCRNNYLLSRSATEDLCLGMDNGTANGSAAMVRGSDVKHIQRKAGKVPRNGSVSFKKVQMLQTDGSSPQNEVEDAQMEVDKLGSHFVRCSNAVDKSQAVKQRNNINGRRGDKRNSKVLMKTKYDPFSLKAGLPSFSPTTGGSNAFGIYGLKPDVHDVTKLIEDISLDELLDGTYKCPNLGKNKEKKPANLNENILDSVRKVCSICRQRLKQCKQTDEVDINVNKKIPLVSSPSNKSMEIGSDGEGSIVAAGSSKCSTDLDSCMKAEASVDMNDCPLYQPRDILEKLALPSPKDLESLLQDAVKPTVSLKLSDSRSNKQLSHRVSLPPFPWSHNFNGHYKSNNDALKMSNKSTCQGRWERIRSTASFIGGGADGFVDLDSLTYDDSLVPAGQLKYKLPETEKTSSTIIGQRFCQQDVSSSAVCTTVSLPPPASHPPGVLAAAQTLCDIASHCLKYNSNGILKWPKQPSQKAMKARKSRSSEKLEEGFLTQKISETVLNHVVRSVEYGSSSKKTKISVLERREEFSQVQAVIGLSSVSAPRSNRSSPSRLSRDAVAEARHSNGNFVKSSFMVPPPPRVSDRSHHNPQKLRKVAPMDWNRTRS